MQIQNILSYHSDHHVTMQGTNVSTWDRLFIYLFLSVCLSEHLYNIIIRNLKNVFLSRFKRLVMNKFSVKYLRKYSICVRTGFFTFAPTRSFCSKVTWTG
jgi:hypothetical protein